MCKLFVVGWLVGWLIGWLVGWLVGWFYGVSTFVSDEKALLTLPIHVLNEKLLSGIQFQLTFIYVVRTRVKKAFHLGGICLK